MTNDQHDDNRGRQGVVFNIQRFTVHDGPGIRTEVFLKGCPLRCLWCDNPESFNPKIEAGVYPQRCVGVDKCGYCLKVCPLADQSIFTVENNVVTEINRDLCTGCLKCVEACPGNALAPWGVEKTVDEVLVEVLKDRDFYGHQGGITISGGEPLIQWEFTLSLLRACKEYSINTCLESALHGKWDYLQQLLAYTDFLITDIKHMDPFKHKEYTGVSNELILENIKKMSGLGKSYIIRIPVVPGYNDDEKNIKETAEFIAGELGQTVKQVQLLAFHEYGKVKYKTLGLKYRLEGHVWPVREVQKQKILEILALMKSFGIPVVSGSDSKIE